VLFECLTGDGPFPGSSQAAVIYGHLEEAPPRVSATRPGLPRALDDVVARALDKNPERRWASGAELVRAARESLAGGTVRRGGVRVSRRRAAVGILAAALIALVSVFAVTRGSRDAPVLTAVMADAVAILDPGKPSLEGEVQLDGAPTGLASGAGAVWVTDEGRGTVSRLDPKTRTIRQTIGVGHGPAEIAVESDGVWVANRQDGTVSVISPETNDVVETIAVGRNVDGICVADGGVWVASPLDYAVVRIDSETLKRTGKVALDTQPAQLACGRGAVWASSPDAGTVTEISASARVPVRTITVGRGASALALGPTGLWVTNATEGIVTRIDPERGVETATIPVGAADGPGHLALTDDAVWVSNEDGGTVARIDLARSRVTRKLRVGNRPQGLALVNGALWVAVADTGARHRGGTLHVGYLLKMGWRDVDPSTASGIESVEVLSLVHDGLVAFRRRGGFAGTTPVPNLAEAVPAPTEGGRTYAFRLRRGLRYSTGEPVLASHVRFGIERALRQQENGGFFGSIRGARDCTATSCDLSQGIVTDDAARTVVFRLSEPDGDLLYKLAAMTTVLPPSVGTDAPARRALPATGPYVIADFKPRHTLRLERNPRFASWSAAARPDGYPDVIDVRLGVGSKHAIDEVTAGRLDRYNPFGGTLPPERLATLRRRSPGQVRATVQPATFWFVLNTRRPPFDELDARLALAHALDRRAAVAAVGGEDVARETCQILPPGFPGSFPYCPFTVPGTGGAAGRPDMRQARALVRRSGTSGTHVRVAALKPMQPPLQRLMVRTLRKLGFDASLRTVAKPDAYFGTLFNSPQDIQIALFPWLADYPAPGDFLSLFSCASPNPSQFCDRESDRLLAQARRLQATDPTTADLLAARAERRIVDRAPAVPVYNPLSTNLVSQRVGNFQSNPFVATLLDQTWVR
jgi:YVTN family beta-propeller protein